MAGPERTTQRQRRGAWAEALAADYLAHLGWAVVARNVHVARDEIDLLAIDGGPPPAIVVVEVRSLHTSWFGAPEDRVDRSKVTRLYRATAALRAAGVTDAGVRLPALPWRVDLVVVDARDGAPRLRHLRALEPP